MSTLQADLVQALDPAVFARDSLGISPDSWQDRALRWDGKRMLLNCSRQTGKSTIAAIKALHRGLYYPRSLVLLVSPSLRQSGELFRKVTDFLDTLNHRPELTEDNRLSVAFINGSRIVSLPSKEMTVRGFSGVNLIIEDEASRVDDALYRSVRPMLAVNNGAFMLMSTPFGKRGHFYEEWTAGDDTWERIEITAYECPRISREFLEEERQTLGLWWFQQEYMCEFSDTVDQIFTHEEIMSAFDDEVAALEV